MRLLARRVFGVSTIALLLTVFLVSAPQSQAPAAGGTAQAAQEEAWPPTGPTPRLRNGKPDFSGVWDVPYVPDMAASTARQRGNYTPPPEIPYTPAGLENIKSYDPAKDGDYTGMCMPFGMTRSINAPYPVQIMQSEKHLAFLFEMMTWFHVAKFEDHHAEELNPTWFGTTIAKWDGDTLILETKGFNGWTRLDTKGNPHSDKLSVRQTYNRVNEGRIEHTMTIDDPVYYTKPWTSRRNWTLMKGDLIEYSCEENNRALWEGRIKLWIPPGTEQPRTDTIGPRR